MSHAGAWIDDEQDTAAVKLDALRAAGVRTADTLPEFLALF